MVGSEDQGLKSGQAGHIYHNVGLEACVRLPSRLEPYRLSITGLEGEPPPSAAGRLMTTLPRASQYT